VTGRERLQNIIAGRPADRLAWTTLVDATTLSAMPERYREMCPLDFYREIGCDILQFGNYGLPHDLRMTPPCRFAFPIEEHTEHRPDGALVRTTVSRWGKLTSVTRRGHPVRHRVQTADDLRCLRRIWENARCEEPPDHDPTFARLDEAVGDDGIVALTMNPSPVQQLLEYDMGVAAFYGFLSEDRKELEGLLDAMQAVRREEYRIVARRTPAEGVIPVENTSATLISPPVYRELSLPHLREYADILHAQGKKMVLHMCGLLRGLLPAIAETGLDGINGLTPPPVGDTPFDLALDALGEDLVILGGVFDAQVFQKPGVKGDEVRRALDALYTPRLRRANLLLWLGADGLPTPLENFLAVADWMHDNGLLGVAGSSSAASC